MFLLYFSLRHRHRLDRLNQHWGGLQRTPKRRPGAARDAPGGPQDGSKSVTSVPRAPPGPPKHGFRAALAAKLGATGTKELPQAILDHPRAGFAPSGGRFSGNFLLSESFAKAVQWAKLAQAYAQHRFTSLCHFYMWISSATDSKSTYIYIYIYTRVDPCIKCTRSKLDMGQGVLGFVAPEDLLSVCCLVLPLVLPSVVLSPLVSSCLGFAALVSSCVVCWASPGPFLGLSRASLGTHFGPPQGHFGPHGAWLGGELAAAFAFSSFSFL